MPKIVDHEERRRHLGAAACAVLSRAGSGGTTVRAIAAEAGMPLATVQHYLPTRDAMVRAAMAHLTERVVRRAEKIPTTGVTVLETLRLALRELVPLDAERTFEARVWLMLSAEALVDDAIGQVLRSGAAELRANLQRVVAAAQADGGIAAHLDPAAVANGLVTLADGLTVRLLAGQLGADDARAEIDTQLARLAAGPGDPVGGPARLPS
ncbi:TetR family transcriptional regulator C-terminal domain-containing protein [Micromonospora sp. R77]|uniref:TetR/AcrR family transcriptional regulator n=1 Tax=Micromonospora sp. R77 TaxID=2925836 RepID=UPI001F619BA0|nr:TetR family transcriptional regulator C-terminal domain-containing protein [Micromonospora sp. R77]MCI4062822.1 TetR family transcriptional regulator C-terminal domain-containing protein [Micromonospora sp. R77]